MNKVILMGRLTRDPEVRYSQGANPTAVARFSIAVDRRFKREGEQAEFIERYLRKGVKILTTGRIQNDNYTNKDGQMVYSVRIMVEEIEFAESKNASTGNEGGFNGGGFAAGNNSAPAPAAGDGFMNIPDGIDEELPFN